MVARYVLGISAFYHDSAAVLLRDGAIVAAAQEERFSRRKHDNAFPRNAIAWCLHAGGIGLNAVEAVVFHEKPLRKFRRIVDTFLTFAPDGYPPFSRAMPSWIGRKVHQKRDILDHLRTFSPGFDAGRLLFSAHHLSHAASAFYPSPFERAAVLTVDGVGEHATTSVALGDGADLSMLREIRFPHSLGLLYSAFTQYTGFKVDSGEYKVMGLAPYGEPRFVDTILDRLITLNADGSFRLNMDYFGYTTGLSMVGPGFADLFGGPPRSPESPLTQREMDLAASVQVVTERAMSNLVRAVVEQTGVRSMCLAGGVALNCVANGKVRRESGLDHLWIQPAGGDAGAALGAALAAWHLHLGGARPPRAGLPGGDAMRGAYLGPSFDSDEVADQLTACRARFERLGGQDAVIDTTARALADGLAVGWFQGAMEFGPRALGARSILGDARSPTMQRDLNLKVKFRESFRPFAPAVLREQVGAWFDFDGDSPYMLLVDTVRPEHRLPMSAEEQALFGLDKLNVPRSAIPAVTHVDYSARLQTVHAETNPRFHALIARFAEITGCPVLINTSFNVRGEPIVATPEDAFRCLMGTDLDMLVIEDCIVRKADQDPALALDYKDAFALD